METAGEGGTLSKSRDGVTDRSVIEGGTNVYPVVYGFVLATEALQLLHQSWGHVPPARMQEILLNGAVLGPTINEGMFRNLHKFKCVTCFRSKLTKPSHQGSLPTNEAVGKFFGCDVYGPIAVPSIRGNVFVYGIIEYKSKHVWLFCPINKKVSSCIESFLVDEIVRLRASNPELGIITFVMDNGESKSTIIERMMLRYNIVQKYTSYNTPEYNALIERFWRTIVEMATAILLDSELPDTYWEDALLCDIYIQ